MRRVSKTLAGALVVLLLAAGFAACGGGGDDSSSSTEAAQGQSEAPGGSVQQGEGQGGGESKPANEGKGGESVSRKQEAAEFVPKQHSDSGGGSTQFKVKGGDNSVQEYGAEADSAEFEAAAASLHDFLDARAERNWAAACEHLSKTIVESFEKLAAQANGIDEKSCAGILEKLTNPAATSALKVEAEKANVGSVRLEGDQGFVIYTGIRGTVLSMPMTKEGDEWKVGSIGGAPLG